MQEGIKATELIAPPFYDLHEEFKHDKYIEYWLKGGRGSTKSTFAAFQIILGMLRDAESNAVCFRRFSNELRDTVYGQFAWNITKIGAEEYFKMQYAPMQIVYLPTGQKIIFKGADNPYKLKSLNIGKGYVKYAWFEEVDQYAGMGEIRNIIQSVFRGDDKNRISIYSYNPPKSGRSWVNQEVKIPKPGRRVHHSNYRDVPPEWLGQVFLTEAEHLSRVNEIAYRHEYLGEEVGTGLEVFNNLTIEKIPDEQIEKFDNIRHGLDFGYAVDPACFLRMHYDKTRRRLYFIDEISGINLFNREIFDKLKVKEYTGLETIADSAEPKSIDELRSYGMRIKGAKKGPGSVEYGVKWLQDLEQIIIDPERCPRSAKEFLNYALEVDRNEEVKSRFPDKDNHAIDAARYGMEDDMLEKRLYTFNRYKLGI
jgi:phage terminase large subunit